MTRNALREMLRTSSFKLLVTNSSTESYWIYDEYFKDCSTYSDFEKACEAFENEGFDIYPDFTIREGNLIMRAPKDEPGDSLEEIAMWRIRFNYKSIWF